MVIVEAKQLLPERICEIPGLSDTQSLTLILSELRTELASITTQMAAERELAKDIHRARRIAIDNSPALTLIFDPEKPDKEEVTAHSTDEMLSSAFVAKTDTPDLPIGYIEGVAKNIRVQLHPDKRKDVTIAGDIAELLEDTTNDPNFSIARALTALPLADDASPQELRDHRYRLSIALSGLKPNFADTKIASERAEIETQGAEWRVRVIAAFKCFELIIGDEDIWDNFLQGLVRERNLYLIDMVNRVQPAILSIQERMIKGDPRPLSAKEIEEVDAVFERIWIKLKKTDESTLPYTPPYQNWLEVLLPAMQTLDPGEKPGEEYTYFEPPFKIQTAAQLRDPRHDGLNRGEKKFDGIIKSIIEEKNYNNNNPFK